MIGLLRSKVLKPEGALPRGIRGYAQDFRIKRVLKLPKQHMYSVVGDVVKYKEFVPYCVDSKITAKEGDESVAMLTVGWQQLEEAFESKITYKDDVVRATAANNKMFKELECEWTITEIQKDQCLAALKLRFEFHNKIYDMVAQGAGNAVSKKMIEAFIKRANSTYQKSS